MKHENLASDERHRYSTLRQLLAACEELAKARRGGHLTIYRFSTGWKVTIGTPTLEMPERCVLKDDIPGFLSLAGALQQCLSDAVDLGDESRQGPAEQRFFEGIKWFTPDEEDLPRGERDAADNLLELVRNHKQPGNQRGTYGMDTAGSSSTDV